jgi:phenylalanyl-tRNA synthetase beta chain
LHPGRSAQIEINGRIVGWIGELHPRWLQKYDLPHAPVLFEVEADAVAGRALPVVTEISKFPPVRRDIALVVPQHVEVQSILDEFAQARIGNDALRFVQKMVLFDEFRPKFDAKQTGSGAVSGGLSADEKSLAFRVTLQDTGGTLQDETVDLAVKTLVERLARVFGARLRG